MLEIEGRRKKEGERMSKGGRREDERKKERMKE